MRDLDIALLNSLDQDSELHILPLASFDFVEGIVRVWAGPEGHAIQYDGEVYTSLADLGQVDKISEAQGLTDSRTIVSLRVGSDLVDTIGGADSRGREAKLILVFVTDQAQGIGAVEFTKTMGKLSIKAAASGNRADGDLIIEERIELELLDETNSLSNSLVTRMTYDQGLRIDSGDHGLEFVSDPEMGQFKGLRDTRLASIEELMEQMDRARGGY